MRTSLLLLLALPPALALSAPAAPPAPAAALAGPPPEQVQFFETKIRPLLVERCQGCHGGKQQQGGLRLDSGAVLRKGGSRGLAVLAADPERSLLLEVVRYTGEVKMPPSGKLSPLQIADLTAWVRQGAPWPGDQPVAGAPEAPRPASASRRRAGRDHWAFQPVRRAAPPRVRRSGWVRNPVDAFVLARLEAAGLAPAPEADRRTLIRRVTYDLTGLPPTAEEVEAYLQDAAPDAWEKAVDRLLATPAYGERWARHWLDVARYADSNGLDENTALATAWRYRDWVVRALNADLPYHDFIRYQLAGDLLPPASEAATNYDRITATGFLVMGPKVLAEPDKQKMVMDIVDEQIDVTAKAFMGLTLSCARCHDHKFDPFGQREYYALAGIFKSTRTMETLTTVARVLERPLAPPDKVAEREAWLKKVQALKDQAKTEKDAAQKKKLMDEAKALEDRPPDVPMTLAVEEAKEIGRVKVHLRGSHLTLGEEAPRQFPAVLASARETEVPGGRSGRLELAEWLIRPDHPLTARVAVNRVWRWHFGRGIVASVDNFGQLGSRPSHPELLDWLAGEFRTHWSLKRLHRLLLTSATYRMSSQPSPVGLQRDPENTLYWRAPVRRLEAEEVRDALLAVTGLLDRSMGGSLLSMKNGEYFFDHTSKDKTQYDSRRRSLYLPVVRNHLYDQFQLFDFGDASTTAGDRSTTTVAPQALFMLNSDLVQDGAANLAGNVAPAALGPGERIRQLYLRLYSRPPSPTEVARGLELVRRLRETQEGSVTAEERHRRAWAWLAHTLLAANEFMFIR